MPEEHEPIGSWSMYPPVHTEEYTRGYDSGYREGKLNGTKNL